MNKEFFGLFAAIFLAFSINSCSSSRASSASVDRGVNWMSFEEAMAAAERNPKKIFIDVYTDWCTWCKKMDKDTFQDPKVAAYMNENFYAVKFDGEYKGVVDYKDREWKYISSRRSGYHELAELLLDGRLEYPASVLMNEKKERVQVIPGYMDANTMGMYLKYFEGDHYKTTPLEVFERSYRGL